MMRTIYQVDEINEKNDSSPLPGGAGEKPQNLCDVIYAWVYIKLCDILVTGNTQVMVRTINQVDEINEKKMKMILFRKIGRAYRFSGED